MESGRTIAAAGLVVMKAVEEDLVEGRAGLALGGLAHGQPQRQRFVLDPAQIARDAPVRRADNQQCRMGELPLRGNVLVAEPHGRGQGLDVLLAAGEEVPAGGAAGAAIHLQVFLLGQQCPLGRLGGVDADGHDLKLLTQIPGHRPQGVHQGVELQTAKHGATGIIHGQHHRPLAVEELPQGDFASVGIDKLPLERQLARFRAA